MMHFNEKTKTNPGNHAKKPQKVLLSLILSAVMLVSAAACGTTASDHMDSAPAETSSKTSETTAAVSESDMFSDRDLSGEYDESEAVHITLNDENSSSDSDQVKISGQTVTIQDEGVYLISGTLSDGQIIVDAEDNDKIQLVLANVRIQNDSSAAIYAKNADKVFVTLAEGSNNTLKTTGEYDAIDDNNIDGVVFAKCDLTLNGSGSLTVDGATGHGIVGNDDVVLAGGNYTITAAKKAVKGNDSIRIADGNYILTAGTDALYSSNSDDALKGFIYMSDGSISIKAGDDAVHAGSSLQIAGGTLTTEQCIEGLEGQTIVIDDGQINITSSDDGLNAAGDSSNANDPSAVDNNASIVINGGTLQINANGDGIDSNGSVTINGGSIIVEGPENDGNGALDAASGAVINGGCFIATGSSGMAENFSSTSTQGAILQTVDTTTGSIILSDEGGNEIISMETDKRFNSVLVSAPQLQQGSTYTLTTGGKETAIEMTSLVVGTGSMMGGDGNLAGSPGGRMDGTDGMYGTTGRRPGDDYRMQDFANASSAGK